MDTTQLRIYVLSALAAVVALTIHEFSHGYAAYKMGDSTAKNMGRLSFNPLKHLDIMGTIMLVLFRIGWAKPVPVNARNFKNPKRGFAITALAGPMANLILAFLVIGLRLLLRDVLFEPGFTLNLAQTVSDFLYIFAIINIGLAIFNLIPVPPLDGSRLLNVILPQKAYFGIMKYERRIYLFVVIWLLAGDLLCTAARSLPLVQSTPWLYSATSILSLSDLIGYAIDGVENLFIKFWELIPFLKH